MFLANGTVNHHHHPWWSTWLSCWEDPFRKTMKRQKWWNQKSKSTQIISHQIKAKQNGSWVGLVWYGVISILYVGIIPSIHPSIKGKSWNTRTADADFGWLICIDWLRNAWPGPPLSGKRAEGRSRGTPAMRFQNNCVFLVKVGSILLGFIGLRCLGWMFHP